MPKRIKDLLARFFLEDPAARPTPSEAYVEFQFMLDKLNSLDKSKFGNLLRTDKILLEPLASYTRCVI